MRRSISRMHEEGLQLRAEVQIAIAAVVVQRLDAEAVAHQHQPAIGFGPDGEREHAAQPAK